MTCQDNVDQLESFQQCYCYAQLNIAFMQLQHSMLRGQLRGQHNEDMI